jgi:phage terminase small subunit
MAGLTIKQENFCLSYIQTDNASEAYRKAGYSKNMSDKTVNEAASRLLKASKVVARLEELRKPIIEKHNVTVESILKELEEARQLAMLPDINGKAQPSAAVSASMGKAKLAGLIVDKQQTEGSLTLTVNTGVPNSNES